jgi:hypothetical protein
MFQLTTINQARLAKNAEFEALHPRDEGGKFVTAKNVMGAIKKEGVSLSDRTGGGRISGAYGQTDGIVVQNDAKKSSDIETIGDFKAIHRQHFREPRHVTIESVGSTHTFAKQDPIKLRNNLSAAISALGKHGIKTEPISEFKPKVVGSDHVQHTVYKRYGNQKWKKERSVQVWPNGEQQDETL